MTAPEIGPTLTSTVFSRNAEASAELWCQTLYQHRHSDAQVSAAQADHWGYPAMAANRVIWLANDLGEPWLRIVDVPEADPAPAFSQYGWLSLEIAVQDVDHLFEEIKDSAWQIIGEPADLDVSDNIRAMQVVGPDGEVLYLTEIKAPVPPFELPTTRCRVDRLFIPVAMVPDRDRAIAVYERFERTQALSFDTKITVINNALGYPIEQRHPVATIQLAGNHLVELDQIAGLPSPRNSNATPSSGIAMISFAVKALPASRATYLTPEQQTACVIRGGGNTLMELIEIT